MVITMSKQKNKNEQLEYFALGYLAALILTILSPALPLIGAVIIAIMYIENNKSS